MPSRLDDFIPTADHGARHETIVRAPADVVFAVARELDLESIFLVRMVIRARERLLGATVRRMPEGEGVELLFAIGWGVLAEEPGRLLIAGAACEPWLADVVFTPIRPDRFAAYAEPGRVKIAWTLEAEAQDPAVTRFATETRVVATDPEARARFASYWRWARFGILGIRYLLLPAVRRRAEERWRGLEGGGYGSARSGRGNG